MHLRTPIHILLLLDVMATPNYPHHSIAATAAAQGFNRSVKKKVGDSLLTALAAVQEYNQSVNPVRVCKEENLWCDWTYHKPPDVVNVNTTSGPRCHSVLDSTTTGGNHIRFVPTFMEWVSNPNSKTKDISYDRLWTREPTFIVQGHLVASHGDVIATPISSKFVNMMAASFDVYCDTNSSVRFRDEFTPERGCANRNKSRLAHPAIRMPWCGDWNASAAIGKIDCGIIENGQSSQWTAWSIYSKYGVISAKDVNNHMSAKKALRSSLRADAAIKFHDTIATVGYVEYLRAPGHFANEILPRLVFMDKFLPPEIPLLWPDSLNNIANSYESMLREYGGLSPTRPLIRVEMHRSAGQVPPSTIVAKNLYFLTTKARVGEPLCLWPLQRLLKQTFNGVIARMNEHERNLSSIVPSKIFVLRRGLGKGPRSIQNHDALMKVLCALTDSANNTVVEAFEVGSGHYTLREAALTLSTGRIFIAPHGAGLNNMFFLPDNATVVEIGYLHTGGSFAWPSDYLCLARNLGFHYFASLALQGDHDSPLVVNVAEIADIVRRQLGLDALPPRIVLTGALTADAQSWSWLQSEMIATIPKTIYVEEDISASSSAFGVDSGSSVSGNNSEPFKISSVSAHYPWEEILMGYLKSPLDRLMITALPITNLKKAQDCMGYLTYIIDNYAFLPSFIFFLSGNPVRGNPMILDHIRELAAWRPSDVGFTHLSNRTVPTSAHPANNSANSSIPDACLRMYRLLRMNIKSVNAVPQASCAQFAVTRNAIRHQSREWYILARKLSQESVDCGCLERVWHYIFGYPLEMPTELFSIEKIKAKHKVTDLRSQVAPISVKV